MSINLPFTKEDILDMNEQCYQLGDGRIFYFQPTPPQTLYVKNGFSLVTMRNGEAEANLPAGDIQALAVHEVTIYFKTAMNKIYRAFVTSKNTVTVTFVRDLREFEHVTLSALCIRFHSPGKMLVYHMWEENTEVGVVVDIEPSIRNLKAKWILQTVHRGKAVYLTRSATHQCEMHLLSATSIGISLPLHSTDTRSFAEDSSPFIYISDKKNIFVLDMEKMVALSPLNFDDLTDLSIVSVIDGNITAIAQDSGIDILISAKCKYVENDEVNAPKQLDAHRYTVFTVENTEVPIQGADFESYWEKKRKQLDAEMEPVLQTATNLPGWKKADDSNKENVKPTSAACEANKALKKQLCNSLVGASGDTQINKILTENEQMTQQLSID